MKQGLKQEFQEHVEELRFFLRTRMRVVLLIVTAVFLLAAVGGYALYNAAPEQGDQLIAYFQGVVDEAGVIDENGSISLFPLMLNNWKAMIFSILYGFVPFLFLPITAAITNAAILGVLAAWYQHNGISLGYYFAGILPHGIFEIPALIIAISLGTLLCFHMVLRIFRHKKAISMIDLISNILRTLLLVIFPLIALSAVIETYITPLVMNLFL